MNVNNYAVGQPPDFRVPSDNLKSLYDLCDKYPVLTEMLGMLPRIRLVIDTNIVLQELLFVTKGRRQDSARSALREVMDCGTVVTIAPRKLSEEIDEHLPRIAQAEAVPIEKLRSAWFEFQARIQFREVQQTGSVEGINVVDPDDVAFVALYLTSDVHAVLTHDKDISKMGAETVGINDVMRVRDYARAKSPEVTIRVGGILVGGVAIGSLVGLVKLIAAALRSFSKLAPEIQMLLIAGAILAVLHPATRKAIVGGISAIGDKLRAPTVIFGEVCGEMSLRMSVAQLTVKERQVPVDNMMSKRFTSKAPNPLASKDAESGASSISGDSLLHSWPATLTRNRSGATSFPMVQELRILEINGGLNLASAPIASNHVAELTGGSLVYEKRNKRKNLKARRKGSGQPIFRSKG